MPRSETVFRVFVASPNDVSNERASLEAVVRRINSVLSGKNAVRYELLKWETDVFPAIGDDAQSVINQQINDDYDVLIVILWSRFGTPTNRADSGTAEEFERAYKRFLIDRSSTQIMVYFKNEAIEIDKLDLDQISKVRAFKVDVAKKGVFYFEFQSTREFEELVSLHLMKYLQDWLNAQSRPSVAESNRNQVGGPTMMGPLRHSDDGMLDLIISAQENFEVMTNFGLRTADLLEKWTARINEQTAELRGATLPDGSIDIAIAKKVTDNVADDVTELSSALVIERDQFSDSFRLALEAFQSAINMSVDFDPVPESTKLALRTSVGEFAETIQDTSEKVQNFADTMRRMPRATTKFNKAKRALLEVLGKIISDFEETYRLSRQIYSSIGSLKSQ